MSAIYLIARREYLAYVGAWGFWVSLITAPLLLAGLIFAPVLLARAEPPRVLAVLADRSGDAADVTEAFERQGRESARNEVQTYVEAAAPELASEAIAAFDAAGDRDDAVAAARAFIAEKAPRALAAFPSPSPRYLIAATPSPSIEGLKPYLNGARSLPDGRTLYGALHIRRDDDGAPLIDYWSTNLQHLEPTAIATRAMRLVMQRETLAQQGLPPEEADRLNALEPAVAQFDPRPGAATGAVTLRERAPFYAAVALSFVLWSVVFSVANMLLSGVIEEKSNKILDTLLTSVSPLELLLGKLFGVAAVSATLFLFWGALGGALFTQAAATMSDSLVGQIAAGFVEPHLLTAFGVGFVAGYLMYGAIFLALGSLCDSAQEAQTLVGPVAIVLSMPMLLIGPALDNPNSPIIETASWVPLFTPFLLLIRAPSGLTWTEIAAQGALMLATVVILLLLAARVFRAGVVHQVSLTQLFGRKAASRD
ncbi:MAG: ABC transporter permease [Hyphomonadaceae bacterium]|nr:ABC transporter permease [Hyphomonadaceae bacterium]